MKRASYVFGAAICLALSSIALATEPNAAKQPSLPERYEQSCAICHASGMASAPKYGDLVAWELRIGKGMDTLLASVKNGYRSMPPKGMCFDCTDDEFLALIEYMAEPDS